MDNYDFARAAFFIRRANLGDDDGPFIASSLLPLSHGTPDDVLSQNLSNVPPRVMEGWFREFNRTISNDREWSEELFENVLLDLRTGLSQAADVLPEIKLELAGWISFVKTQAAKLSVEKEN